MHPYHPRRRIIAEFLNTEHEIASVVCHLRALVYKKKPGVSSVYEGVLPGELSKKKSPQKKTTKMYAGFITGDYLVKIRSWHLRYYYYGGT